ncbi:MAG: DNA polymerase domain-containing protein [Candidatus Helarchaeota archaeon]
MSEVKGWLLDLNVDHKGITLWVLKENRTMERVQSDYVPVFHVHSKSLRDLKRSIASHPHVESVDFVRKRVDINDTRKRLVLEVRCDSITRFRKVVSDLERVDACRLFDIDIPLSQRFLYHHDLFPLAFGEYSTSNGRLSTVSLLDSQEKIEYDLPPVRVLRMAIKTKSEFIVPRFSDELASVTFRLGDEKIVIDGDSEPNLLLELSDFVKKTDPDIIFTDRGDAFLFPYLIARASYLNMDWALQLCRDPRALKQCQFKLDGGSNSYHSYGIVYHRASSQFYLTGRIHLDESVGHFWGGKLPALVEVARVSRVPLQRLSRITIGGALQSIQMYHALKDGILIPPVKKNAEYFKSAYKLMETDKGGHIFEPRPNIYDNVLEFDFTSMYPTLMREYNISPETIFCKCCPDSKLIVPIIGFPTCEKRQGLVPRALDLVLRKRVKYKQMCKDPNIDPALKEIYKQRRAALKWILVVSFGYLGFKNARFGRIEGHQAVTAYSRELLLRSAEIARKRGYEVIHGIVDSLWLKNGSSTPEDHEEFCKEVETATKIPLEYDGKYKFVLFLPTRANRAIGTLNHYWGVFTDGSIKVRGLEVRRRDTPKLIKKAQHEMIQYFARHANNSNDFKRLVPIVRKKILQKYVDKIRKRNHPLEDLLITMRISRHPAKYKGSSRQAIAARQLHALGIKIEPGENVQYILTNIKSKIPSNRVCVRQLLATSTRYDVEAYIALLKRAFQNLTDFGGSEETKRFKKLEI